MTRHRRDTNPSARRDSWVRVAIAAVVGFKLLGFIPVVGTLTAEREGSATVVAALAADPTTAPQRREPGKDVGVATDGEREGSGAAGGPQVLPGDPPPDGPSAAFAEQSKVMHQLLEAIKRRSAELDLREAELVQRETALGVAEEDLDKKIAHLESLTAGTHGSGGVGVLPAPNDRGGVPPPPSSMDQLGRIYGAMKAEEAAPLLDRLDNDTVRSIFSHMKQKQISEVLPLMKPEKAVALTVLLSGRRPAPGTDAASTE